MYRKKKISVSLAKKWRYFVIVSDFIVRETKKKEAAARVNVTEESVKINSLHFFLKGFTFFIFNHVNFSIIFIFSFSITFFPLFYFLFILIMFFMI